MDVEIKIEIKVKGKVITLDKEEAKELYNELHKMYNKETDGRTFTSGDCSIVNPKEL